MLKSSRDLAEQSKKLPQATQLRNILNINSNLSNQYKDVIEDYYTQIIQPLSSFLSNNQAKSVQETLKQSTNALTIMLNQYQSVDDVNSQVILQEQHANFRQQRSLNLLDKESEQDDIVSVFKKNLQNRKYPLFTPYLSSFPNNAVINENLKIMIEKEGDLREFKEQMMENSPYDDIINETDQLSEAFKLINEIEQFRDLLSTLQIDVSIFEEQLSQGQNTSALDKYFEAIHTDFMLQDLMKFKTGDQKKIIVQLIAKRQEIKIVSKDNDLEALIEKLGQCTCFGLSVIISEKAYYPKTCYVCIIFDDNLYIIDALELENSMFKLRDVLTNNKITKIMFDSGFIAKQLQLDYRLFINGVVDIKILYQLLYNKPTLTLPQLVAELFDYEQFIEKYTQNQQSCTDFSLRHITDDQIKYMQLNSIFLIPVSRILMEKINQRKDLLNMYNKQVKEQLTINVQQQLNEQNEQLFNNVYNAKNERQFYADLFLLYVDVVARRLNERRETLFDYSRAAGAIQDVNLRYTIAQQMVNGDVGAQRCGSGLLSAYVGTGQMTQFDGIAKVLRQHLTQNGNFNQQQSKYKAPFNNSFPTKVSSLNYELFCQKIGINAEEAQQISLDINSQLKTYRSKYIDIIDMLDYELPETKKRSNSDQNPKTFLIPERNNDLQEFLKHYLKGQQTYVP